MRTLGQAALVACTTALASCAEIYDPTFTASPSPIRAEVPPQQCPQLSLSNGDRAMARRMLEEIRDGRRPITDESMTLLKDVLGDTNATIMEVRGFLKRCREAQEGAR